mmetsp:Transcript_7915/g.48902  ORF Transcript_7915/g.48902 Transcript_7915/m.48902 type:complete len:964 (-) Transcript_7915:248-3139(-)
MHYHAKRSARPGVSDACPGRVWFYHLFLCFLVSRCMILGAQNDRSTSEAAGQTMGEEFAPTSRAQSFGTMHSSKNSSRHQSNASVGQVQQYGLEKFQHLTLATTINVKELKGLDEQGLKNAIEWRAITSFLHLIPARNIIVYADDRSDCPFLVDVFGSINCHEVPCFHPKTKRPVISCIFEEGEKTATTEFFSFVNGDIILSQDFISVVEWAVWSIPRFLLIGKRVDVHVTSLLSLPLQSLFGASSFTGELRKLGEEHGEWGIDVFVYRVGDRPRRKFPPFVAGNWRWDNWLLSEFMAEGNVQVIDISKSALILHQDKAQKQMMAKFRPASAYNNFLAHQSTGEKFQMGKITNADILVAGGCSRSGCIMFQNTDIQMEILIHRRASPGGYVVLLTVNSGYIDLFKNWLCWSRLFHFQNFIVLAEDGYSYNIATQEGCTAFMQRGAPRKRYAVEYGSKEFQETMTFRTNAVLAVLKSGFHAVIADLDTVWLEDPLPFFQPNCTLLGQKHKEASMSGGLVVVRGGHAGVRFWKQVIECQELNMEFIANHALGTYDVSKYTEQECINRLGKTHATKYADFSYCLLPKLSFPDGRRFFEEKLPQLEGLVPTIIHNNWIKGKDKKAGRFKDWGLWLVEKDYTCQFEHTATPRPVDSPKLRRVKIHLVDIGCLPCLEESLNQLQRGLAEREPKIYADLTVHMVDERTPLYVGAVSSSADRQTTIESFEWTHGTKNMMTSVSQLDQLKKMTDESMLHTDEGDIVLVVDVASNLPQHLWQFVQGAADGFNKTLADHSARLIGYSIHQQFVREVLAFEVGWLGHQLVTPGAILLGSAQWKAFQVWTGRQLLVANFSSCLPQLPYNQLWTANSGLQHQWWWWMTLYSFHYGGFFVLPPKSTSGRGYETTDVYKQFQNLNITALPVYDYMMKSVNVPFSLALRKKIFSHLTNSELCTYSGPVSADVLHRLRLVS